MLIDKIKTALQTVGVPWVTQTATVPPDFELVADYKFDDCSNLALDLANNADKLVELYAAIKEFQPRMILKRAPLVSQKNRINAALAAIEGA